MANRLNSKTVALPHFVRGEDERQACGRRILSPVDRGRGGARSATERGAIFISDYRGKARAYRPCSTRMMRGVTCPREAALMSECFSRPEVIPRVRREQ